MYRVNIDIPGWSEYEILLRLCEYAQDVPNGGNILELGALFGRTTYSLGHNKHLSVHLYVIELWPTIMLDKHTTVDYHDGKCGLEQLTCLKSRYKTNPDRLESADCYDLWKKWTDGISNLHSYMGKTTDSNSDYPMFDLIYHDADHSYVGVYNDLCHWYPKLKDNGIIIVDDYHSDQFSGVCRAVDQFVSEHDLSTHMITDRNILIKRK